MNEIEIVVTSADKSGLDKMGDKARRAGKEISDGIGKGVKDAEEKTDKATAKISGAFNSAAKDIARDLERVEREAWESGKGLDREFIQSLNSIRDGLDRVRADAGRTGKGLESDLGGSLRDIKRDMDRLGEEAKETGREIDKALSGAAEGGGGGLGDSIGEQISGGLDIGGMFEGALGKAGASAGVAAGAAAVGSLIADQAFQGFQNAWKQMDLGGTFAAQTGGTLQSGMRLGKAVGEAYRDGFGESMEDVGATAGAALGKGLAETPQQLGKVTRDIETLGEVTGRSAEEIASAARTMVKSGLVDSVDEAMDLMVVGAQRGADAGSDMIETLAQSSATLKQFGLDGRTSVGAFKQALDAGAPSADTFVGALEELAGNASDAIPVFQQLGLGGKEFANALAGGGPAAASALDQLLDKVRAIPDPAERARVMVGLFGEEATAMSDALLAVDLDKAAQGFDNIGGASDKAAEQLHAFNDPIDQLKRNTAGWVTDPWARLFDTVTEGADEGGRSMSKLGDSTDQFADSADDAAESGHSYAQSLHEIIDASAEAANNVLGLSDAQIGYQESLAAASEALTTNGKTLDLSTEKGRENQSALNDLADQTWDVIEAMKAQNATTDEVRTFMDGARASFVQAAIDMGMEAGAANQLADKLGLIPGDYTAKVHAETGGANAELAFTLAKLRAVSQIYTASVRVNTVGNGLFGAWGRETGGITTQAPWGAATGGQRHGSTVINEAGPEVVDLPNGSRVMTAGATRAMGEAGLLGGGGATQVVLSWGGTTDPIIRAILDGLRVEIKNSYGGSATAALNQRGAS